MRKNRDELYPEPGKPSATRLADKLVQVYRKDGKPEWLLVHLEIQGKRELQFPERMFRYFYRILDRWRHPVTAIAILTGSEGPDILNCYRYSCIGTELQYRYNVLRIRDFSDEDLLINSNPFAVVMLIAKKALLEGKVSEEELVHHKLKVARTLLGRTDMPRRKVKAILTFLNNYILFNKSESNSVFKQLFDQMTIKKNNMTFQQRFEKMVVERECCELRWKFAKKLVMTTQFSAERIAELSECPLKEVQRMKRRRSPR